VRQGSQDDFDADYYKGNEQSGDRIALWFYARIAARLAPEGSRAFEYGSGEGHLSRRLARRYRSSAYDLSPYARATTARNSPQTTIVESPDDIEDASLDLICSLHVLEHVPVPADTLGDFARWLRPGGKLMYVVPNPQGWGHRIKKDAWFAYRDDSHCSLLSHGEWIGATRDAGFAIDTVAADGLWDPPYVPKVPRVLQLATFGLPAAVQVGLGRAVLPAWSGECLIVVARRLP
jgi:SAM-dependent methyltransferase